MLSSYRSIVPITRLDKLHSTTVCLSGLKAANTLLERKAFLRVVKLSSWSWPYLNLAFFLINYTRGSTSLEKLGINLW